MRVVFLQDVPDVAEAGEVKEVADGFGRNYLIPRGLAALATKSEMDKLKATAVAQARQESRFETQAVSLKERLESTVLTFRARAGQEYRLFGSITNADIAGKLTEMLGEKIDKRRVELKEPIRHLGSHEVVVRLAKDLSATVSVNIEPEGD